MAVTDLTGTKWVWNDITNLKSWGQGGTLYRSWTYSGNNFEGYYFNIEALLTIQASGSISTSNCYYFLGTYNTTTHNNGSVYYSKTSTTPTSSTTNYVFNNVTLIEITGGTDVTNSSLISWLEANATQIIESTTSTYIGSSPLDKCYVGSNEVQKIYVGDELVYEKQESGPVSFATDSWATIATAIKSGNDPYSLGDTKTDTITIGANTYTGTFKIVDNLVGRYTTQSGSSHKVIELQELVHNTSGPSQYNGFAWRASYSTGTGYPYSQSDLADNSVNTMDTTILAMLPSDLQAVLETTTVKSSPGDANATASNLSSVSSKLFCAAVNEYYEDEDTYGFANNYETDNKGQFTYYKNLGVTFSNYSGLIKNRIEDNTANYYWMRSPYNVTSSNTLECYVYSTGSCGFSDLRNSYCRVAPCFSW